MRWLLIAWLAGCGHDAAPPPTAPPAPVPLPVSVPVDAAVVIDHTGWARMPDHPFVAAGVDITYTCTANVSPTRGRVHELWADLRGSRIVISDDEGDIGAPTSAATHRHRETKRALSAAQVATLKADLGRVLAGGPYEPERTGDQHCELALTGTGSQDPFFRVQKDRATTQDAVGALIRDIAP